MQYCVSTFCCSNNWCFVRPNFLCDLRHTMLMLSAAKAIFQRCNIGGFPNVSVWIKARHFAVDACSFHFFSNINKCVLHTQLLQICIFSITGAPQRPNQYTESRKLKRACIRAIYTLYEEPQIFISCQNDTNWIFVTGPISPKVPVSEWRERSWLKCFQELQFHVLVIICVLFTKLVGKLHKWDTAKYINVMFVLRSMYCNTKTWICIEDCAPLIFHEAHKGPRIPHRNHWDHSYFCFK